MSPVTCHVSHITCLVSHVNCNLTTTLCSCSCYSIPMRFGDGAVGDLMIDKTNQKNLSKTKEYFLFNQLKEEPPD